MTILIASLYTQTPPQLFVALKSYYQLCYFSYSPLSLNISKRTKKSLSHNLLHSLAIFVLFYRIEVSHLMQNLIITYSKS